MSATVRRAALLIAASALALGLGEVAARVKLAALESARDEIVRLRLKGPPELRWFDLFKPNQDGVFRSAVYRTNSYGFPGPERTIQKPAGTRRLVLIGDSFTQGSGVPYEDTYGARLEEALNAEDHGRWEVLNLGVPGFNIQHSVDRYKRDGRRFAPDILVYGFTLNDIENPYYVSTMTCSLDLQGHLASRSRLWRIVGEQWRVLREALWAPPGSYVHELEENYTNNPAAWHEFTKGLDSLAEVAAEDGICAVMFIHTQLEMLNSLHPYVRFYDQAGAAARDRGIAVIPSLGALKGLRAADLRVGLDDAHPNARGHKVLAEELLRGIRALPAACLPAKSP